MHIVGLACAFLLLATSSALVSRSLYDACSLTCGCMHKVGAEIAYQLGEIKISVAGLHNDFSQVKYKFQDASSTNLEAIGRKETDSKNLEAQIKSIAEEVKALKQGATHSTNSHNSAARDECSGKLEHLQQSSQAEKELLEQSLEQVNQSLSAAEERIKILNSSKAAVCNASSEKITQLNNTNQNLLVCLVAIKNLEGQLAERKDEIDWLRNATLMEPDEKENKACVGEEERFQKEINSTTAEKEELERKLDAALNELLTANETIQNLQDEYNKLRAEMVKTKMMGEERAPRDKGAEIDKIEEDLCDSVVVLKQTIIENESVKKSLQTELQKINQTAANALERADDLQQKLDSANVKILEMETSLQNAQQEASNASKITEDLDEALQNNGSSLENSSEMENQEQLEAAQKAAEEARENATRLFTELELKAHELAAAKERLEKEVRNATGGK
ncbi:Hypothetical predicted protein [Cloeon dipterum]|uniref:Uncharacterized protein n=1 Tax=Cloeon dipterum TaxID=197152 RepID=A0A8S1DDF9_9INSE|nr:Hypothetical predicted protein [Cloeon dipterum]